MAEDYAKHLEKTWRDRHVYWRLRGASQVGSPADRDWLTIIVDGADQAKFRVMKSVTWPKSIEGEHRPQMKVVGALAHGHEMSFNFVEENVPKGSTLTIEVLVQCLERVIGQSLTATPPNLWVQVDNCGGKNKNRHLLRFLSVLVDRGLFCSCALSFLQVGHTHEDIDVIFGIKSRGIQHMTEWDAPYQMAEQLGRGEVFVQWKPNGSPWRHLATSKCAFAVSVFRKCHKPCQSRHQPAQPTPLPAHHHTTSNNHNSQHNDTSKHTSNTPARHQQATTSNNHNSQHPHQQHTKPPHSYGLLLVPHGEGV